MKPSLKISLRSTKNARSTPPPGFEEREIDEIIELPGNLSQTALYVFKPLPNGYIIVSSTKKDVPILAFSNNKTVAQHHFVSFCYGITRQPSGR